MKKTYIIPDTTEMPIEASLLIAQTSLQVNGNVTVQGDNGGWVKKDTPQDYHVWDDDWTK